jgi:outer membrane protein OmpA-like peptidoglycan-associated protein/opacity protein-like surface antigen
MINGTRIFVAGLFVAVAVLSGTRGVAETVELGNEAPWYLSPAIGLADFEGDQDYKDGLLLSMRLGYDFNDRWTFEGVLSLAPSLDANAIDGRPALEWDSANMFAAAVDGLFHFTRWERLDPYLAAGVGYMHYSEDPAKGDADNFLLRGGGGVMYHFNDEWAVRADYRGMLAGFGSSPNANATFDAGVVWNWGAGVPAMIVAVSGSDDTDGDGLPDVREVELRTDPFDPDTDKDGLSDGDEVNRYRTDPLNRDTDYDSLGDGDEVRKHKTDPLKRDTDGGGVADGHEVIEDGTNPLVAVDDLRLFELYINFDLNEAVIRPEYNKQLDVIVKVLSRNPESTARIEGHADRTRKSGDLYNRRLSKRRADAVGDYLSGKDIAGSRLETVGYGFTRPKAANDPLTGNPANRRVEVYIRGADGEPTSSFIIDADPAANK